LIAIDLIGCSKTGTDKLTSSDKRSLANFVQAAAAVHALNALSLRFRVTLISIHQRIIDEQQLTCQYHHLNYLWSEAAAKCQMKIDYVRSADSQTLAVPLNGTTPKKQKGP
jgi:hypothetical protein